MFYLLSGSFLCVLLAFLVFKRCLGPGDTKSARLPYPPGPKPLPIIGNLFDVPSTSPWLMYTSWRKQYGDVIHLKVLGQHIVIVNSAKAARDLFEKRVHSDRPPMAMVDLMGWDFVTSFKPYNDQWRKHRRVLHQSYRPAAVQSYEPMVLEKSRQLLRNLIGSPEEYSMHFRNFAASVVMQVKYGYQVAPRHDRLVALTESTVEMLTGAVDRRGQLVNAFPALRHLPEWMPGAGFQTFARKCRDMIHEMQDAPFDFVKNNMANGVGIPCSTSELLEENDSEYDELIIKETAATAFVGGADTVGLQYHELPNQLTFMISDFFNSEDLLTCNGPLSEAQKKAQDEIDHVVGLNRLPNFDDRNSLVYVEALVREVMRWHPPAPLAVPHATMEDDVYDGYLIPKGTTLLGNVWAILHDNTIYPNPDKFYPDRFISSDGRLSDDLVTANFGFGRRICAGENLARTVVWIAIASILSAFRVTKAKDEMGEEIEVVEAFNEGFVEHPLPFACSITPRSNMESGLLLVSH